jgi:GntR family transcriptional regulator
VSHHYLPSELGINPVDENSLIPRYQQIRFELMKLIQSGKLKAGDMLPPEKALASAFNVSRQTIRQAIGLLASDYLVERTPGRGTTVLDGKTRQVFFLDQSFAQQMLSMGMTPQSEVLRQKISTIDDASPATLHPKKGCPALELFRLRFADGDPIGVQYTIIITEHCPNLAAHDFSRESLYNLFLSQYQLMVSRIDHSVSAVTPDDWHKNLLRITDEAPLLLVNTTAFLDNDEPIEASTSYYRADRYEFSISKKY